ncbi:MAG: hypothetical protein H6672_20910 [Anaerolineaceae bacterium]|nr:hypothetical protein [Anaerolineaceae bacterium]
MRHPSFSAVFTLSIITVFALFATTFSIPAVAGQDATATPRFTLPRQTRTPAPIDPQPTNVPAPVNPLPTSDLINVRPQPTMISITTLPRPTATLPPRLQDLLDLWREYGAIHYDPEEQSLQVAIPISESALNTAIQEALGAIGYDAEVTVDLVENGMNVTFVDHATETTYVLNYVLVSDSGFSLTLVSATVNGQPVPPALLDSLDQAIKGAINGIIQALLALIDLGDVEWNGEYTIDNITINESTLVVTATIYFAYQLPEGQVITIP